METPLSLQSSININRIPFSLQTNGCLATNYIDFTPRKKKSNIINEIEYNPDIKVMASPRLQSRPPPVLTKNCTVAKIKEIMNKNSANKPPKCKEPIKELPTVRILKSEVPLDNTIPTKARSVSNIKSFLQNTVQEEIELLKSKQKTLNCGELIASESIIKEPLLEKANSHKLEKISSSRAQLIICNFPGIYIKAKLKERDYDTDMYTFNKK